jgi:hypothetical protein
MASTGRRPGFLSPLGIALALALLAALVVWVLASDHRVLSPGELNAETVAAESGGARVLGGVSTHAALRDCAACHPAPFTSETIADRCLGCHTSIRRELRSGEGLHARLAGTPADPTCAGCHPEHHGPHGALTSLDPATFPHDVTGFSLRTHRRPAADTDVPCRDCHAGERYLRFDQARCTACHRDLGAAFMSGHETAYGKDCLSCHDGTGEGFADFDHAETGFPLKGGHVEVACADCHDPEKAQPAGTTPTTCFACHAADDEHDGAFGRDCGACHTVNTWDDVTFDHAVFPLDHGSEERQATCETCHPLRTTGYTCYGCHEHTRANVLAEHEGRSLAALRDCVECHQGGREAGD